MSEKNFVSYGDEETLITEIDSKKPGWSEVPDDLSINVLPKHDAGTFSNNGITYVVDDDGTITCNGTASGTRSLFTITTAKFKEGTYWFNGCPAGGAASTYFMVNGDGTNNVRDYGSGVAFTVNDSTNERVIQISIYGGVTVSDLVFSPMIVRTKDKGAVFTPHITTNKVLDGRRLYKHTIRFRYASPEEVYESDPDTSAFVDASRTRYKLGMKRYSINDPWTMLYNDDVYALVVHDYAVKEDDVSCYQYITLLSPNKAPITSLSAFMSHAENQDIVVLPRLSDNLSSTSMRIDDLRIVNGNRIFFHYYGQWTGTGKYGLDCFTDMDRPEMWTACFIYSGMARDFSDEVSVWL